jgi:hypothetical protein
MPIAFITLKMVFVLAWTVGDASSLTCQSLNQVHLVYSSMSSGLLTQSKLNTVIRCGTTEKVAMELLPKIFGFMTLPSVALRSGASFFICMYGVILETE